MKTALSAYAINCISIILHVQRDYFERNILLVIYGILGTFVNKKKILMEYFIDIVEKYHQKSMVWVTKT